MAQLEKVLPQSIPEQIYRAAAYVDRADSLLEAHYQGKKRPYAPWSLVTRCSRRVREIGQHHLNPVPAGSTYWQEVLIPEEPVIELDEYWKQVVLPATLLSLPRSETPADPVGRVLLSIALQRNIPHNGLASQAAGWYVAQQIVRDAENGISSGGTSIEQLLKGLEPALSAWILLGNDKERSNLSLAAAILKRGMSGKGMKWLEQFTAEFSKKFYRIDQTGWAFWVPHSVAVALQLLSTNKSGKTLLQQATATLRPDLIAGMNEGKSIRLEYFLEQIMVLRLSAGKNVVTDAIKFAESSQAQIGKEGKRI